ncbi:MAG: orotate phosphoribosyltransferase [Endomicrobiia bacterium]
MRNDSLIDLFKKHNALLEGHFLLSSGLHSNKYLQCALVLQYPELAEKVAMLLFEEIKKNNNNILEKITVVVSPALGGIIIGQEMARVIKTIIGTNVRAIFTERDSSGEMVLRRGFNITKEDNVLIVEDVVTTGKSTNEVIEVVQKNNGNILSLSSIINRGNAEKNFKYPYFYISKVEIENFDPQTCPLCKQNIELVKPGSRK